MLAGALKKFEIDQCLECIGQDGRALASAAPCLAFRHAQHIGNAEGERGAVKAFLAHEVCAHPREVAFIGTREALVEQAGHRQVEHRVTQELEAFVVVRAKAAVGDRALQQGQVVERMAQPGLQGFERGVHVAIPGDATAARGRRRHFDRPSYLINRYTGAISSTSFW